MATTSLLRANIGVLKQKLDLITALQQKFGPKQASIRFAEVCPIVGASVGQHFRHSIDHMELVVNNIAENKENKEYNDKIDEIHYDIRVRGRDDESNMDAAEERILGVKRLLEEGIDALESSSSQEILEVNNNSNNKEEEEEEEEEEGNNNKPVVACFMLSGDPAEGEYMLSSTIERELGFAAHHTIHHLAMVKIITTHTLKLLPSNALPEDFGRAPSTVVHDKSAKHVNQINTK